MQFAKDAMRGASTFLSAFAFVMKHRMGWMFVVPAVLWILFAFLMFNLVGGLVEQVGLWAAEHLEIAVSSDAKEGIGGWWETVKAFINSSRDAVLGVVLRIALMFLFLLVNKYIVLIVLSPLMAYASELTEQRITGREYPFEMKQFLKDVLRGALIAARNGLLELLINIVAWITTLFVPIIAPFTAIGLFLVSSYFYGFSMFDYVHERRRSNMRESLAAMRKDMGMVIANGALFSLLMKIPLVGMMAAPVMASVGASRAFVEKYGQTGTQPSMQA